MTKLDITRPNAYERARRRRDRRRGLAIVALGVCTALSLAPGGAWAAPGGVPGAPKSNWDPAGSSEENQCGDANEYYGVSEQIVSPPQCSEVEAGEWWRHPFLWFTNTTFEMVPTGYVPSAPTPMEDFVSKFVGMKYVIDSGTGHEQSYFFSRELALDPGLTFSHPLLFDGRPFPASGLHAPLRPLRLGAHEVHTYIVMNAAHCDGLTDDPAFSCLPAGESPYHADLPNDFQVVPRAGTAR